MRHTTLGRTGLTVSRLGFGAMRLPMKDGRVDRDLAVPMIHRAFEAGVNFIDTAVFYCDKDSQVVVGEALQGWRDRVVVSTKNHCFGQDEKEWWTNLEDSLRLLRVDSIDLYNTHGVNARSLEEAVLPRVAGWLRRAKDRGLIRHIGTSFHDSADALRKVVDSGIYESVILQYNLLDRDLEEGMAHAKAKGLGVIVMGPVGGGRLGAPNEVLGGLLPDVRRMPELALRFVLSNPSVDVALSGMETMEQVEENVALVSGLRPFSAEELGIIDRQLARLRETRGVPCTACKYCQSCQAGVDIPRVFSIFNSAEVYGLADTARREYGGLQVKADACSGCGACEETCPQKIAVRGELRRLHGILAH